MTENSSTNTISIFKAHFMSLTGCNEETAQYCAIASQGKFSNLREVDTTLLTESQRRKADSLNAAIQSIANEHSLTVTHIKHSSQIYQLMYGRLQGLAHEEVWAIYMSQSGKVIHLEQISKGGMTGTIVDIKIVLRKALQCAATRMILVHNHPSGSVKPSQQDIALTKKIESACNLIDLQLVDHVVIAGDRYYSFVDEGLL